MHFVQDNSFECNKHLYVLSILTSMSVANKLPL